MSRACGGGSSPPSVMTLGSAVLANNRVEARQVAGDGLQIREAAPCRENHRQPARPRVTDRLANGGIEYVVDRRRAVVVDRYCRELHGHLPWRPMIALARDAHLVAALSVSTGRLRLPRPRRLQRAWLRRSPLIPLCAAFRAAESGRDRAHGESRGRRHGRAETA